MAHSFWNILWVLPHYFLTLTVTVKKSIRKLIFLSFKTIVTINFYANHILRVKEATIYIGLCLWSGRHELELAQGKWATWSFYLYRAWSFGLGTKNRTAFLFFITLSVIFFILPILYIFIFLNKDIFLFSFSAKLHFTFDNF